jgi:DNA-binding response OmpR family regulator
MYTVALSVMGFQPVEATTAEDAFAEACNVRPDAIVTDMVLPDVSGLDLTRRLRSDPRTTHTSIIVLTGHSSDSTERRARDAGCDRFLIKPCLPDALAVAIRDVLASRPDISESK